MPKSYSLAELDLRLPQGRLNATYQWRRRQTNFDMVSIMRSLEDFGVNFQQLNCYGDLVTAFW